MENFIFCEVSYHKNLLYAMRDSDAHSIPKGVLRMMTPTWLILMTLIKSTENVFLMKFTWVVHIRKTLLKWTKFHHENMQRHVNPTSFGVQLNLNIFGTPHIKELIFWFYTNNTKYNTWWVKLRCKSFSFLSYLTLSFLKNTPTDRYNSKFHNLDKWIGKFAPKNWQSFRSVREKNSIKAILSGFVNYRHSKYATKSESSIELKDMPL